VAQRRDWLEISRLTGCEVIAVVFEAGASTCVERVMLRCADNPEAAGERFGAVHIGKDTLPSSQDLVRRV